MNTVDHPDMVPGGRLKIVDDDIRPWLGVGLYCQVATLSLPGMCNLKSGRNYYIVRFPNPNLKSGVYRQERG